MTRTQDHHYRWGVQHPAPTACRPTTTAHPSYGITEYLRPETLMEAAGALTMLLHHLGAISGEIDQAAVAVLAGVEDEWNEFIGDLGNAQRSATRLLIAARGGNDESKPVDDSATWFGPN